MTHIKTQMLEGKGPLDKATGTFGYVRNWEVAIHKNHYAMARAILAYLGEQKFHVLLKEITAAKRINR